MERTTTPAPGDGGGGSGESTGGAFTRKASGLVREFSQLDAWIYNVLALNLVVLIALAYVAATATFPQASLWLAVVICGVFCTFEAIAYAFFLTIMPRSGGDYVFQSRILGGGVASVFVFTAIVLSQTVLVALTAYLGATLVLSPFFLLLGAEYDWQWLIDVGDGIATPGRDLHHLGRLHRLVRGDQHPRPAALHADPALRVLARDGVRRDRPRDAAVHQPPRLRHQPELVHVRELRRQRRLPDGDRGRGARRTRRSRSGRRSSRRSSSRCSWPSRIGE